ncbi:MAG: DUF4199 domain-containing protein [Saprospiraceae bacterium]|nr:DUF4199 domain-containing protein [Saprospiraceae bacterium]
MSITLKWGLITGMVYVIFSLVSNMLGLQQGSGGSAGLGILIYLLQWGSTFFTIYLGVKEIRENELGGYIDIGQAFKKGMAIALIGGLISALFTLIYMNFIDPEMGDRILEGAEDQWDQANMPEEQREMSRKIMGIFLNPWIMAPFVIVWIALGGMVKSLIAGSILKKEAAPTVPMA